MTWKRRLAEMVLAGGTIAAAGACSTNNNEGTPCCNANGDPCCTYKYCGGPLTPECACQMDGGMWNGSWNEAGVYSGSCGPVMDSEAPEASEAAASEAAPTD